MDNKIDMILPLLNRINGKLNRVEEKLDMLSDEVRNVQVRLTHLERGQAEINSRLDMFGIRLDRVEKRLDLTETAMMEAGEKFEGRDD